MAAILSKDRWVDAEISFITIQMAWFGGIWYQTIGFIKVIFNDNFLKINMSLFKYQDPVI